MDKILKFFKLFLLWLLTVFAFMGAMFLHRLPAAFFLVLAAFCVVPLSSISLMRAKIKLKFVLAIILYFVFFIAGEVWPGAFDASGGFPGWLLTVVAVCGLIFLQIRSSEKKEAPDVEKPFNAASRPSPPSNIKKMLFYPSRVGEHPLRYNYEYAFSPAPGVDIQQDILAGEEKVVDVRSDGDQIVLSYNAQDFGYIHDKRRAEMLSDWEGRGSPAHAILLADGEHVMLRFYQAYQIGQEWREQTVVKLTAYRGAAKQELISILSPGDLIDISENYDKDGVVTAYYQAEPIGNLPAKAAKRALEEEPALAICEKVEDEETEDDIISAPYIRIFW